MYFYSLNVFWTFRVYIIVPIAIWTKKKTVKELAKPFQKTVFQNEEK